MFIIKLRNLNVQAFSQLRICRPTPPQFWCSFNERRAMCWNEWKINFPIFIFRFIVNIHRKLGWFEYKSTKDMQTPPFSFDLVFMDVLNVLKRMKNQFSDFYFSSYHKNPSKIGVINPYPLVTTNHTPFPITSHFWTFSPNINCWEGEYKFL